MKTGKVYAVLLAAGTSRRFGAAKLLEPWHGRPLLHYPLEAAREACPGRVCVVTGHCHEDIARAVDRIADEVVFNPQYEHGIGTSLACGVRACSNSADGIVVMLADQPLVTGTHLGRIIDRWSGAPDRIVATGFDETRGPPVLFGRQYFDALEELSGDAGARTVLEENEAAVEVERFDDAAIDIDTRADMESLSVRR